MGLMISLYVGLFMEIMNIISYTIKVRTILVSIVILNLMRVIDKIASNLAISGLDMAGVSNSRNANDLVNNKIYLYHLSLFFDFLLCH